VCWTLTNKRRAKLRQLKWGSDLATEEAMQSALDALSAVLDVAAAGLLTHSAMELRSSETTSSASQL
jgi:hypothetical protein